MSVGILKRFGLFLSDEEHQAREEARREAERKREFHRQLAEEAAYVADLIQRRLVQLNICYHYKTRDKRGILQRDVRPIEFEQITATPEAHYLKVLTRSMPRGVKVADLYKEETVEALGYSIGTDVSCKASKRDGFWYVVPRRGRLGGIPSYVKYTDALAAIPQSAPVLAFPVGYGENKRFAWDDLEAVTNLLIAGSKGGGKSNALNMILCSLIQRAGPDDLRLFLVDLKAGMEFVYYAGIPHLGGDVPYVDPETGAEKPPPGGKIMIHGGSVIRMLEYVLDEIGRRGNVLRGKAKKLSTWNKRYRKSKIPYWVVVIDELGDLMLDRKYRSKAENMLSRISQLGRAVGVHLILATQTPNKDTVPRLLKNNLDARLAFRCADGPSSQIVVDNYDASYIPKVPGRMLYVGGHHTSLDRVQVQTPFISDGMVKDIVRKVRRGEAGLTSESQRHDVSSEELFKWALDNGGSFSVREVHKAFRKRGLTVKDIMEIGQDFEREEDTHEPRIEIDDELYHLEPAAGSTPRTLVFCVLCNENPEEGGDAADAIEEFEEWPGLAEVSPGDEESIESTSDDSEEFESDEESSSDDDLSEWLDEIVNREMERERRQ